MFVISPWGWWYPAFEICSPLWVVYKAQIKYIFFANKTEGGYIVILLQHQVAQYQHRGATHRVESNNRGNCV